MVPDRLLPGLLYPEPPSRNSKRPVAARSDTRRFNLNPWASRESKATGILLSRAVIDCPQLIQLNLQAITLARHPHNPTQASTTTPRTRHKLATIHEQISSSLRGSEFRSAVSNLQGKDLGWFVEYLDGMSLQTTSPFKTDAGSHWYFRSRESSFPGILARTQTGMLH